MDHDHRAVEWATTIAILWQRDTDKKITAGIVDQDESLPKGAAISYFTQGAYNRCYKLDIAGHPPQIARFPVPGYVAFRSEKARDETFVINYLQRHTSIPVPRLLEAESSPLGPYSRMEFLQGTTLSELIKAPSQPNRRDILSPDVSDKLLDRAYRCMANVILQMWKCRFDCIGGITKDSSGQYLAGKRPLTLNMNQLVTLANFPPQDLCQTTFRTANEYFQSLAKMHCTHLRTQQNDSFFDELDCRKKYVARQLFLKVAGSFSKEYNHGPFPLFCDDLRPSNVMVDKNVYRHTVFDWDFSYAAPVEFTTSSPWWLLLLHPDDWPGELDDFLRQYRPLHERFITVLESCEDTAIKAGNLQESERLSLKMKTSLQDGTFWFCLAATSSARFDDIYWQYLDPIFFGPFHSLEDRIANLGSGAAHAIDAFVQFKLSQTNETFEPRAVEDMLQ